jgi:hypothetical protein
MIRAAPAQFRRSWAGEATWRNWSPGYFATVSGLQGTDLVLQRSGIIKRPGRNLWNLPAMPCLAEPPE